MKTLVFFNDPYFRFHEELLAFQRRRRFVELKKRGVISTKRPPLSIREAIILLTIEANNELTIKALSQRLKIDQSWMSRMIGALEEQRLIKSTSAESDARSKNLSITPTGKDELKKSVQFEDGIIDESISNLSIDEKEHLFNAVQSLADGLGVEKLRTTISFSPFSLNLIRLSRGYGLESENYLDTGLNILQLQILLFISIQNTNSVSINDLNPIFPVDQSTLSRTVATLTQKKFIQKNPSPEDKRSYILNLRHEGEVVLENYYKQVCDKTRGGLKNFQKTKLENALYIFPKIVGFPYSFIDEKCRGDIQIKNLKETEMTRLKSTLKSASRRNGATKSFKFSNLGLFVGSELQGLARITQSLESENEISLSIEVESSTPEQYQLFLDACFNILPKK